MANFWKTFEALNTATAGTVAARLPTAQLPAAGGGVSYFTYPTNTVMGFATGGKKSTKKPAPCASKQCELTGEPCFLRAVSVGCRCRFCSRCCYPAGKKIRERLLPIAKGFTDCYMLTLTVDPKLFASDPGAALDYLQQKRCIARLVRSLRRISAAGLRAADGKRLVDMHTDRFFCSLEFQDNETPHFHVLLDASRIDFDTLCVEWGRFRPAAAPALAVQDFTSAALRLESQRRRKTGKSGVLNWQDKLLIERDCFRDLRAASKNGGPKLAPAFGHVRFSSDAAYINGSRGTKKAERAAKYVTKYIFKEPDKGWPAWVLDRPRLRRFSTSRGFWSAAQTLQDLKPKTQHKRVLAPGTPSDCPICSRCGEFKDGSGDGCTCHIPTIRERLKTCGQSTNIVEIKPVFDPGTLRVFERVRHLYKISMPLDAVLDDIASDNRKPGLLRWDIPAPAVEALKRKFNLSPGTLSEQHLAQLREWQLSQPLPPPPPADETLDDIFFALESLQNSTA